MKIILSTRMKWILGISALLAVGLIWGPLHIIESATEDRIMGLNEVKTHKKVALVLGCSPKIANGRPNLFFVNRMETASQLWHRHQVDFILVSGDNHTRDYDEPTRMKEALVKLGIPVTAIILDAAGFTTLDSMARAKEVFGLNDLFVISQKAHVKRAVFLADHFGICATGVIAPEVGFRMGIRTRIREIFSRIRAIMDVTFLNRHPHFLGPKIEIPNHPKKI